MEKFSLACGGGGGVERGGRGREEVMLDFLSFFRPFWADFKSKFFMR